MNVPPTKESGKPVMHHYTSDSLVDFSHAEHDPDCPGCEIERLREAIASALTSLATGPMKDGYAYAVLSAALERPE